ncbi:MAG: TolC family protein [Gammaproteobacteria bacterium]|nr:TolC family protein [Gammaproteobacteria bacterium]
MITTTAAATPLTLTEAFAAAWQRQPEAHALPAWQAAVNARAEAAASWLAAPAAVELSAQSDQFSDNLGSREYGAALALPLWLWAERAQSQQLATSERDALTTITAAAMLNLAAQVRSQWWQWQRAQVEVTLSQQQEAIAKQLQEDVHRRLQAGELSNADQHLAKSQLLAAVSARNSAELALLQAQTELLALTGWPPTRLLPLDAEAASEALPELPPQLTAIDPAHPQLAALLAQADVAKHSQALVATRRSANPELTLGVVTERDSYGEDYQPSLQLAVRIPLGAGARHQAELAAASAERLQLESRTALRQQQLLGELELARQRVTTSAAQARLADEQARLAVESAAFYRRAFELGEADLPNQLRLLREAGDAVRSARLAVISHNEAISQLRQALGVLPQ